MELDNERSRIIADRQLDCCPARVSAEKMHSRGRDGVGHASLFNQVTSIKGKIFTPVVPLDGSNIKLESASTVITLGASKDGLLVAPDESPPVCLHGDRRSNRRLTRHRRVAIDR